MTEVLICFLTGGFRRSFGCGDTAVGVTSFGDPCLCNSPELPEVCTKISALYSMDKEHNWKCQLNLQIKWGDFLFFFWLS